jgi:hypothetical protein
MNVSRLSMKFSFVMTAQGANKERQQNPAPLRL